MDYRNSAREHPKRHDSLPFDGHPEDLGQPLFGPPRYSFSSPATLNRSEWQRNYKESVREYGPPAQHPSLFLFGRDEFERCETKEAHSTGPLSPQRGASDPEHFSRSDSNSPPDRHSPSSAPECGNRTEIPVRVESLPSRRPSWQNEPPERASRAHRLSDSTASAHSHRWPSSERKAPSSWPSDSPKKSPVGAAVFSPPSSRSWPEHAPHHRRSPPSDLRTTAAHPKDPPGWTQRSSLEHLPERRRADSNREHEHRPPPSPPPLPVFPRSPQRFKAFGEEPKERLKFFGVDEEERKSPTVEQKQHNHMIAELKARFLRQNPHFDSVDHQPKAPMPTPTSPQAGVKPKSPRVSPPLQHAAAIPADPPTSAAADKTPARSHPINEFRRILQSESQVLPVIERFLQSNFKESGEQPASLTDVHEADVPLQHYWQRVFEVSDGRKNATIKIENLLTIEKMEAAGGDSSPDFSSRKLPLRRHPKQSGFIPTSELPLDPRARVEMFSAPPRVQKASGRPSVGSKSTDTSADELPEPKRRGSGHSPLWLSSLDENPGRLLNGKQPPTRTDGDMLQFVHLKIAKKMPLDWAELFLVKNAHVRHVIPRERHLHRLTQEAKEGRKKQELTAELMASYRKYQEVLEHCSVIDDLYTQLAFLIMKAESYWYAARICSDVNLRSQWYRKAVLLYRSLLQEARGCLPANDRSLLTILQKISVIMLESCFADQETLRLCRQAIGAAEQALEEDVNVKMERKLIKIKNALMTIETNILH